MKKLMFTLALLSAFTGQAQAELKWKKIQAGASSGGGSYSFTQIPEIIAENVYTAGINSYGELGHSVNFGTTTRTLPMEAILLRGALKCQYSQTSGNHGLCFMKDGKVMTFGHNFYGQLGRPTSEAYMNPPDYAPAFEGAKQCHLNYNSTICVMENGSVKVAGYNVYGALGLGNFVDTGTTNHAVLAPNYQGAKECYLGSYSSICLMPNGTLKGAGQNKYGELANAFPVHSTNRNPTPNNITNIDNVKECSSGGSHVVCIMNNGIVKTFGWNKAGQLGTITNFNTDTANPNPLEIFGFRDAIKCVAGHSTICIMPDGTLKGAGQNNLGQLGISGDVANKNIPTDLPHYKNAKCDLGHDGTVCIMDDGTVKVSGGNFYGALGVDINSVTFNPNSSPITVPDFNGAKQCSIGYRSIVCTGVSGTLLPPCNSNADHFGKTSDGTKYICKNNKWVVL